MTALREALRRWKRASEAGDQEAMDARAREVLRASMVPTTDRDATQMRTAFAAAAAEALATDDETRARETLLALAPEHRAALLESRVTLAPVANWASVAEPAPVLWREPITGEANSTMERADAVLSVGECAILAAPGGTGKSYLTLNLAAAAAARKSGEMYGTTCGLRVRPGPVVLVSYEDSPVRLHARLRAIGSSSSSGTVHCWPDPAPLFAAGQGPGRGDARPTSHWIAFWNAVRELNPALVIIDPVSAALEGAGMSEGSPVRTFMRELAREANETQVGVLLVAHDTKAARDLARAGEDPGAGAVAGSATWYDAARGVLYMVRDGDKRTLKCIKANYGRSGWTVTLNERFDTNGRFGGFTADSPKPSQGAPVRLQHQSNPYA